MRRRQCNTGESSSFKFAHGGLDRFGFASDYGHFRGVFVGGDHVTFRGFKHLFDHVVWSRDAGHQTLIVDLNSAHFRTACGGGPKRAIHVQNSRRHEGGVFAQRVPGDHVRRVAVSLECPFNGQIRSEHGGLSVFCLLEFVLRFLQLLAAE